MSNPDTTKELDKIFYQGLRGMSITPELNDALEIIEKRLKPQIAKLMCTHTQQTLEGLLEQAESLTLVHPNGTRQHQGDYVPVTAIQQAIERAWG